MAPMACEADSLYEENLEKFRKKSKIGKFLKAIEDFGINYKDYLSSQLTEYLQPKWKKKKTIREILNLPRKSLMDLLTVKDKDLSPNPLPPVFYWIGGNQCHVLYLAPIEGKICAEELLDGLEREKTLEEMEVSITNENQIKRLVTYILGPENQDKKIIVTDLSLPGDGGTDYKKYIPIIVSLDPEDPITSFNLKLLEDQNPGE